MRHALLDLQPSLAPSQFTSRAIHLLNGDNTALMTSLHPVNVVCTTVLAALLCCSAEIFSSVAKLKALPHLERTLLKKFQDFLKATPGIDEEIRG
ncbi:hypothetical protein C0Q70_05883 [Pomacea canaliculata]|uniref:Uncharacterized protein n=1 Tax=Pomacea canaliculata TaxID=400727 RepID=A0A2T7PMK1_POMCA|nr:hypothetical protein C0Q70_05883 [Pomacea canaliculata]